MGSEVTNSLAPFYFRKVRDPWLIQCSSGRFFHEYIPTKIKEVQQKRITHMIEFLLLLCLWKELREFPLILRAYNMRSFPELVWESDNGPTLEVFIEPFSVWGKGKKERCNKKVPFVRPIEISGLSWERRNFFHLQCSPANKTAFSFGEGSQGRHCVWTWGVTHVPCSFVQS